MSAVRLYQRDKGGRQFALASTGNSAELRYFLAIPDTPRSRKVIAEAAKCADLLEHGTNGSIWEHLVFDGYKSLRALLELLDIKEEE